MRSGFAMIALTALAVAACDRPISTAPELDIRFSMNGLAKVSGGGHYLLSGALPGTFAFTAIQVADDGTAKGHLRHTLDLAGELIEFHGVVTCLTVDPVNNRAWVGGVVTKNKSVAQPYASEARFQPGQDIWFRILDNGNAHADADRTTFTGFAGDAGFATSLDYCAGMPWPADNARTHPVTAGDIHIIQ